MSKLEPAARVITTFGGRSHYREFVRSPEPITHEHQKLVDYENRRKQLEQELKELQEELKRLQAELEEAPDTNVVEDFLQGVGVQDSGVDDIQAAMARVSQRMKEIQEELLATSEEVKALLAELQNQEDARRRAIERMDPHAAETASTGIAEVVRASVRDAVGPYSRVTVEVNVFPPPPASTARGPVSDVETHRDQGDGSQAGAYASFGRAPHRVLAR